MLPLDRAIMITYKLLKLTMSLMSLSAAFWPQFWMQCFCLQLSLTWAKLPYLILALILASSIATSPDRVWDCSLENLENRYLSATGSRTLAFRYRRYGQPIAVTAGISVLQDTCCIHVRLQIWIEWTIWRTLGLYFLLALNLLGIQNVCNFVTIW